MNLVLFLYKQLIKSRFNLKRDFIGCCEKTFKLEER